MKKLVIIGAGDFGREVSWLVERINARGPEWELLGFVDDGAAHLGAAVDGYPLLGTTQWLQRYEEELWVVCSIGTGRVRKACMDRILTQPNLHAATLVDPAAIVGRNACVEEGCVVCAGTVLAISSHLFPHTIVNINCTIGHDSQAGPFVTVNPGSNVSGKVQVESCCDLGTGSKVIQGLHICSGCTIGAGAVVVRDITQPGTYVGVPARLLPRGV